MTVDGERQVCDSELTTVIPRMGSLGPHDLDGTVDDVIVAVVRARASTDLADVISALATAIGLLSMAYGAFRDRAGSARAPEYEVVRRHLARAAEIATNVGRANVPSAPETPELLAGVLDVFSLLGVDRIPLSVLRTVLVPTPGSSSRELREQLADHGVRPRQDDLVRPTKKCYHLVDVERAAGLVSLSAQPPRLLAAIHAVCVEEGLLTVHHCELKDALQQMWPALLSLSDKDFRDLLRTYGITSVRRGRQYLLRRLEVRRALGRYDSASR